VLQLAHAHIRTKYAPLLDPCDALSLNIFEQPSKAGVTIEKYHGGYMTRIIRPLLLGALIGLLLCGYSEAATKKSGKPMPTTKGVQHKMKTYYMGRFAIDLPEEFKLEIQSQKVRYAEISDFKWRERDREKERNSIWAKKIAEIKKLKLPKGKNQIIIEEVNFPNLGKWAKGILYYGNYVSPRTLYWMVLLDNGVTGIWLHIDGIKKDQMSHHFMNLLSHYKYGFDNLTKNSFCLEYGRFELPYEEQESTYARFAGSMGMKLEIDMNETHQVEEAGVLDRLAASLATNFAPGVDVEKKRIGKRKAAGLSGQEIIIRTIDDMGPELFFAWDYLGKEDSGEHPEIKIGFEGDDGNLEEKTRIWDAALDSFRPVYKH